MLSGILNSDKAISVNIQIMRIFTRIRHMLLDNTELRLEIEKIKKKRIIRIKTWSWFSNIWMSYWRKKKNQENR